MNQQNDFPRYGQQQPQQYGLNSFDTPPGKAGLIERVFGSGLAAKFSSPLFATAAFVIAGVAFAGLIVAVYPDSDDGAEVPTVKADTLAYKEVPSDPGGMVIPNRDSTIFTAMNDGSEGVEPAPIENLLAEDDDEPVDKLAAFARQVEEDAEQAAEAAGEAADEIVEDVSTMAAAETEETKPVTLQKIAKKTEEVSEAAEPVEVAEVEPAPVVEAERPKIVHKAGENPDTLEFVKSVLDQKDAKSAGGTTTTASAGSAADVATRAAAIAPASGTPGTGFDITPGSYYVQVGSVKSLDGAEGQWGAIQKEFSAELSAAPHRVQAADLGERGTFYRIQAGPMSKESAGKICDSIKTQKPGGCLVTQ